MTHVKSRRYGGLTAGLLAMLLSAPSAFSSAGSPSAESATLAEQSQDKEVVADSPWAQLKQALNNNKRERALKIIRQLELGSLTTGEKSALESLKILLAEAPSVATKAETLPTSPKKLPLYGAFSAETNERVERNTFESLDHVSTLFTQGITAGASLLNTDAFDGSDESVFLVPAVTGLGYALFAAYTLGDEELTRGDIPLIDGVAVYLPSHTVLLASGAFWDSIDTNIYPWLYFGSSVASLPLAFGLSRYFDPDPGDAQLIRDSVFWGGVLGWGSYLLFHPDDSPELGQGFPLVTLGASLALGAGGYFLAQETEYSLERIRSATMGGYIGGVVGGLLSISLSANSVRAVSGILMTGAGLGLAIGFASTAELDLVPEGAMMTDSRASRVSVSPGPLVFINQEGEPALEPGLIVSGYF